MSSDPDESLIEYLLGTESNRLLRGHVAVLWAAEAAYLALMKPARPGPLTVLERKAIAGFAAMLLGEPACISHYRGQILAAAPELAARIEAESLRIVPRRVAEAGGVVAPLSPEAVRMVGRRLAAGLEHVARLVLRPGVHPAPPGWDPEALRVLTEIIALVTFQARTVAGLRAVLDQEMDVPLRTAA